MKAQRCSWVDMLEIRQSLSAGERGDQARLQQMRCVNKQTVSNWAAACQLLDAIDGKVQISGLSEFQPSHATEITKALRKQSGRKKPEEWPDDVKEKALEWVERVEEEKLTVVQLQERLKDELAPKPDRNGAAPALLPSLQPLIDKGEQFGCIYADPPWQYEMRPDDPTHRGRCPYKTMTVKEICDLPITALAADNAHLHLWTTNNFLRQAFDVLEAWGFEQKSCFVWCKPQIGLGHYWRVATEYLLLGVRGSCPFRDNSLRNWESYPRTRHSAKPPEIRGLIERVSPGPHLELFGRKRVKGWIVWGNQDQGEEFRQESFAS